MTSTNNPIELLVKIAADTAGSKTDLNTQLKALSAQLDGLKLGIKIDDQSIKGATSGVDKLAMKMDEVTLNTQKAERAQRDFERAASAGADKIGADWGKAGRKMLTSIEQVEKEFKGKDFTVKSNFDVKSGMNSLKSFQVDVKQTEDVIERITYKLRDMGGVMAFEPSSMQQINKASFDLSKNLNVATDKLNLLNQEGKISNTTFNELIEKANKIGTSSGFKKFEAEIKTATVSEKQLNEEIRQQVLLQERLAGSISNRTMSMSKDDLAQTRAKNTALDAQYIKYEAINKNLEQQVFLQKLTQEQANKFKGNISVQTPIAQLKEQETLISRQVVLNQRNAKELKDQAITQEQIRKITRDITTAQKQNPKAFGNNSDITGMLSSLERINPAAKGSAEAVARVSNHFKDMKAQATEAGRFSMGVMESFKVAMEKFPVWMAASTVFYQTVRSVGDSIRQIIELDTQMTVLRRVAGDGVDANTVLLESVRLAGELGNLINDVNDGFIAFARQGYRGGDLTMLTEYATLLGNISDMSVDESASTMTAALKGFNMEIEESLHVVNALNETDNNFAITTKQLAEAMTRSAGAASTYGVSLERTIGYTTAIGQVTRESGSIIGNSLKSIYSRITSISGAVDGLADIGIGIKDSAGEMRKVDDILDDLGGQWNGLNAEQQQNLGLQIAGRFQLSRFLILMNQYSEAMKAADTATDSAGSGYRENAEYLKSYEAQINKVKNAWTEAILSMQDSGLGDGMILGLEAGLGFFNVLNLVVDKVGVLPAVLGGATIAFALLNTTMKTTVMTNGATFLTFIKSIPLFMNRMNASILAATVSMNVKSAATRALTASYVGLRTAAVSTMTFLAGTLLPIAGFMALGTAITFVVSKLTEHKKAQKELTDEINNTIDKGIESVSTNKEAVDVLIKSYENLSEKKKNGEWNTENEKEYLAVQQELGDLFPSLIKFVDEKGRAHLKTSEEIQKEVGAMEELLALKQLEIVENSKDTYKERIKSIKDYQDELETAQKKLEGFKKTQETALNEKTKEGASKGIAEAEVEIRTLQIMIANAGDILASEVSGVSDAFLSSFTSVTPLIEEEMKKINDSIDFSNMKPDEIDTVRKSLDAFTVDRDKAFQSGSIKEFNSVTKDMVDYLVNNLGLGKDEVAGLTIGFNDLKLAMDASAEAKKEGSKIDDMMVASGEELTETTLDFKDALEQLTGVTKAQMTITDDLLFSYEKLAVRTELTAEEAQILSDTENDLLESHKGLSGESLQLMDRYESLTTSIGNATANSTELAEIEKRLLAIHPSLISAGMDRSAMIESIVNNIKEEQRANDILLAATIAASNGKLKAEENASLASLEETNARIKNVNAEILALDKLRDAYSYFNEGAKKDAIDAATTIGMGSALSAAMEASRLAAQVGVDVRRNSKLAELATATNNRTKYVDILSQSEEVLANTTTQGNKALHERMKADQKSAKETEKADKSQKDYNITIKESIFLANTYKEALEKLNLEKSRLNEIKSRYPKHSKEYQDALKKELILLEQEKALNSSRAADVNAQIKSGNVRKTGIVTKGSGGTYTGKYASEVNAAAAKHGIDANLIAAVIQAESNFNPNAKSKSGAQGLMQLMPATARGLGVKDSYNVEQNIMGGAKYLAEQLKAFGGDIKLALAAYNAGPNAVKKAGGIPKNTETTNYVKKITDTLAKSAASTAKAAGQSVADYYSGNGFKATSGFGARTAPTKGASTNHKGQDFSAPAGTSIKSLRDGKVIASLYHSTGGNMISVQQDDGTVAKYMHMQSKSKVAIGQSVKAGQEIGKVGSTGTSTGNHLHLQIEENGKAIDPVPYLKAQADATSAASQIVAETAQDIDALKSDLNQISENNYAINEKIRAVQREIIQTDLDKFNNKRTAYQNILDYEAVKMDTLDKTSQRYIATLQRNSSYLEKKQAVNKEELAYLESLIKSGKLSNIVVGEMRDRMQELTAEMLANGLAIQQLAYDEIVAEMSIYEEKIDDITYAIERSKLMQEAYDEGSADHIRETELQISLLKKHQQEIVNERNQLQKSLLAKNISAEMTKELGEKIEDLSLSYWQLTNSIRSTEKALEESNKQMAENLANTLIDSLKSVISERRDAHMRQLESEMDAENDRHEAVMNGIDAEMDAEKERHDQLQKSYDYQIEMEEKKHKIKMDKLQKELRAFERYIQSQIEGIDRVENTRTYDKDIDQLLKEKAEIQAAINNLAGDDSYEATAKKKELNKQLVDVDDKIFERTNAREIELRKENYDDLLEKEQLRVETIEENENKLHEQKLDDIKELKKRDDELHDNAIKNLERQKKAQEANHKANVKNIDDLKRYYTQFYEDQLNNEREFARIKEEIVKGNLDALGEEFQAYMDEMIATMPELENTMNGTMQAVGTSVRQNLIDNLKEAIRLMDEFNRKKNTSTPVSSPSGGSGGSSGGGSSASKLSSGDLNVLTGKFLNDRLSSIETNPARKTTIKDKGHSLADTGRASGSTISSTAGFDAVVSGLSKEEQAQLGSYLKNNATGHVSSDYLKDYIRDYANKLIGSSAQFAVGGNTGKWSGNDGKLAVVHPEEQILNKGETSRFFDLIPALQQIASLINPISMPTLRPPTLAGATQEGNIEINFHVDKMTGSKSDVDNFSQQIARRMKREKGVK